MATNDTTTNNNLESAIADLTEVHKGKMSAARGGGTSKNLEAAIDALTSVRAKKNKAARKKTRS